MRKKTAILFALLFLPVSLPLHAGEKSDQTDPHKGHREHGKMMQEAKSEHEMNVQIQLYDLELLTQDGKPVRFKSDVIGDKLVAVTFTYTTCTTICPVFNALFMQTQELLGERLGSEVNLITMTLDPARDIPQRMKKEAKKFKSKPGWLHLTGKKENVDQVLRGMDAYFADFTQHPPMVLVGDGQTGTWKRFNGFPRPQQIVAMIDELEQARSE